MPSRRGRVAALAALTAALSCAPSALARPEFVARLPNGGSVPSVAALGHVNPNGGGATNAFGANFGGSVGRGAWTTALCVMDSDGDGQSNGLELGDPCCAWAAGAGAPAFTTGLSHPGLATSVSPRNCSAAAPCATGVNPCAPTPPAGGGGNVDDGDDDDEGASPAVIGGAVAGGALVLGGLGLVMYRRQRAAASPPGAAGGGATRHAAGGLAVVALRTTADAPDGAADWRMATTPAAAAARAADAGGYYPPPQSAKQV